MNGEAEAVEIYREPWNGIGSKELHCPNCDRPITLWFNGGELDSKSCCGYEFYLEHTEIDFVIRQEQAAEH